MSQDSKFLFGDDENTSRNIQSKQDRKQKRVHRRKHNPKKSRLTKKTISIHPFAMIGVMTSFAYPAVSLSHYTDSLATHSTIKHETFALALSFSIFSFIVLIWQTSYELDHRKKVLERGLDKGEQGESVDFPDSLSRIGQLVFAAGLCLAAGGAFSASQTINNLDSSIPSQASTISKQTAALNYYLIFGAVAMLIGYILIRSAIGKAQIIDGDGNPVEFQAGDPVYKTEIKDKRLLSAKSIQDTNSVWVLFIMGLGTAGAFALKSAPSVPKGAIIAYSLILFASAAIISLPKIKYAQNMKNKLCELLGKEKEKLLYGREGLNDKQQSQGVKGIQEDMQRLTKFEDWYSLGFLLLSFSLMGGGVAAACYGDPMWGTILIVFSMMPLFIAGVLARCASQGIEPKISGTRVCSEFCVNASSQVFQK